MRNRLADSGIYPIRNLEFWAIAIVLGAIVLGILLTVWAVRKISQPDDINVASRPALIFPQKNR